MAEAIDRNLNIPGIAEDVTCLYIITDRSDYPEKIIKKIKNLKNSIIIHEIYTTKESYEAAVEKRNGKSRIRRIQTMHIFALNVLSDIKDIISEDLIAGTITGDDRVAVLVNSSLEGLLYFNADDIGISYVLSRLEVPVNEKLIMAVLQLSLEIAREGREGRPTGALFVIGDTENVMKYSRQVIINPFKGHSKEQRNVMDRENWETIKELAQLDGAILIDDDGIAQSAGRYIGISWDIYLQGGLGGRHLAAASVSKNTNAVAVTVSTSHVIRVFSKGKMIFKLNIV